MTRKRIQKGFTLIEAMIVVALISILAAMAYPSYKEAVARSRRAEARTILIAAQQWMEHFYSESYRYDQNKVGVSVNDSSQFPSRFTVSPTPGEGVAVYNITVNTPNRDSYTITATRIAGRSMASDRCGDYSIDYLGRKNLANYSGFGSKAAALEACWK